MPPAGYQAIRVHTKCYSQAVVIKDNISTLIDIEHYPLAELDTPRGQALLAGCRASLAATGAAVLPGFLRPAALTGALANAIGCAGQAHQVDHAFGYDDVYPNLAKVPLQSLPADHPRRLATLTRIRFVARDLIAPHDPVKRLHGWPPLADFIARVMQLPRVHPSPCPLGGCVFTLAGAGELQDWHFDSNDFIVTLMLQAAVDGGHFEYVPGLREPAREDDFDGVRAALAGEHPRRVRLPLQPGALTLFRGRYNFHRASPVRGERARIMAVLSFDQNPHYLASPTYLRLFFGRETAMPASSVKSTDGWES